MERPELTLVGKSLPTEVTGPTRAVPLALALILALSAGTASLVGIGDARSPVEPRELARRALSLSLETGNDSPEVRQMILDLRTGLGRRPLDSGARVVYAALLLNLARQLEDTDAAAHHAARAADLSPVTVPIVRLAVLTLTRAGDADTALEKTGQMFSYDPRAAANLLAEIESLVDPSRLADGLPVEPDAWFAWSGRLRRSRRLDEAYAWNLRTHKRWPDHLPTLRFIAARAVADENWDALETALPESLNPTLDAATPEDIAAAPILVYRGRLRAARGDSAGARADVRQALTVGGNTNLVQILAGEAFEQLGDHASARRAWNKALFDISSKSDRRDPARRDLLTKLARLEDAHGRPSTALRLWRSVLELDAAHAEARRRVRDLGGYDPLE